VDGQAELSTMVLTDARGRHERSSAALRIAAHLGGVWRLAAVFWLVPRPVRDGVYDFIARRRHRWLAGPAQCRLPTAEERARFLP
jgi:predicted DCC family thiol-disulfide oxidoreductase YuxK